MVRAVKSPNDVLSGHLDEVSGALAAAALRLRQSGDITALEAELHDLCQCLTLLEMAALCIQGGSPEHAENILDHVAERRRRSTDESLSALALVAESA